MNTQEAILWQPLPEDISHSRLNAFRQWLRSKYALDPKDYEALWQWSVDEPALFWESIAMFFNVHFYSPYKSVFSGDSMPDVDWFPGSTLNYAEHIYKGMAGQKNAIYFASEVTELQTISVPSMWQEVSRFQQYYLYHNVQPGDRIAGYLPNIPEATYAFLAAISLGAVWSCCSPDFGVSSVVDRFAQIEPVLFIAADGYYYGGKTHERSGEVSQIRRALQSVKNTLTIHYIGKSHLIAGDYVSRYEELPENDIEPRFIPVPFAHPLWILYSSGTTGAPKAITHSHGGCLLEHLKYMAFHNDVHAGETFFWYTTTGWMMWNFLQAAMLAGAPIVLYDGSPGYPSLLHLWHLAAETKIRHFGTSAPFLVACMKENLNPAKDFDLSGIRSISSTGSPLPPEAFDWVYNSIHNRVWLCSMSGGTDVCTAFVGGVIEKNIIRGEIQCRGLGCSLFAFDEHAQPVYESLGEMVITKPMPSMPVYFWNDPEKMRYKASYFEDIDGVWRHGDWVKVTRDGGIIIYGRSDATLNRQGIRIGTAEIYRALHEIMEIEDSLIVNLELSGGRHYMPLFVMLKPGYQVDDEFKRNVSQTLRSKCSPRHVPDDIIQVDDIPYTISGKKMETPVKKILMGMKAVETSSKDAMRNPESLAYFENYIIPPEKTTG